MTDFIIETDLGHDPDDLFTICHLIEAGHNIVALGLSAGSPEQQAFAVGFREVVRMDFEIGVQKADARSEQLGIHSDIAKRRFWNSGVADGMSSDVFARAMVKHPNADILIIGPATGIGNSVHLAGRDRRLTFQGGFLPYSQNYPQVRLPQFEGKGCIPTFNFNGDRGAVDKILASDCRLQFCGKNVCHTVVLSAEHLVKFAGMRTEAGHIYHEALGLYFRKHFDKKLHDPTALVCHLHPEVGTWVKGTPMRLKDGWTTVTGDHSILADINRDLLWHHIFNRT